MNQIEDSIEAPITDIVQGGYDEEDADVEQPQNDDESMNHDYNIKWFGIVAIGAFSAFLGIGLVLGIPMTVSQTSVRSLQSNDCSDTNWYWHPDEQKCARGKGALGISFSELSACCKQEFGENGCDWHDECKRKQPDVVETSDGPVEVDNEEFFKFYDNDNSASSVSSALGAVDYTTQELASKSSKSGGPSGAKSGKSSGSKSSKVAQLYINENLDTGDAVTVYEAGPIKIEAGCGTRDNSICNNDPNPNNDGGVKSEACLVLTLFDANEDLFVFGDADEDSGLENPPIGDTLFHVLDAGVTYKTELWDVSSSGNDVDEGGVWANGFYVGYDGESFIGVRNDTELGVIGGNCQIAGVFNYVIP